MFYDRRYWRLFKQILKEIIHNKMKVNVFSVKLGKRGRIEEILSLDLREEIYSLEKISGKKMDMLSERKCLPRALHSLRR